jgi:hypothetical protein
LERDEKEVVFNVFAIVANRTENVMRSIKLFFLSGLLSVFLVLMNVFVAECISFDLNSLPISIQQQNNWCWAAASQSVLAYYGSNPDQCAIANIGSGGVSYCCPSRLNNPCDLEKPFGTIQNILTQWGVNSNGTVGALPWATSVTELNSGRPFIIGIDYTYQGNPNGGHYIVARGYDPDGQYIDYMDPAYGYLRDTYIKLLSYSWTESGVHNFTATWTESLRSTTNPRPACETGFVSTISATSATLRGTINTYNTSATVSFEYGTTTSYGGTATADQGPVTGNAISVSATISSGLIPNTTYHFRVKAVSSSGTSYSSDQTFTTSAAPITAVCGSAYPQYFFYVPTALCTIGIASPLTISSDFWSWTCKGSDGSTASCFVGGCAFRYMLATTKNGTGTGTITISPTDAPPGIDGVTCSAVNGIETLTAHPSPGSMFTGWSGCDTINTDKTCTVNMTSSRTVSANFTGIPIATVTPTSDIFNNVFVNTFSQSHVVKVMNTGAAGLEIGQISNSGANPAEFVKMTDGCSGQTIGPNGSCSVQISFVPTAIGTRTASINIPTNDLTNPLVSVSLSGTGILPTLTVNKKGDGTGMVTSSSGGISCGSACSATLDTGTPVTLMAIPENGNIIFGGWSGGGCSGTGNCTVPLNTNSVITATFNTAGPHTINVANFGCGIVSPAGPIAVSYGMDQTLSFSADSGAKLTGVLVDGVSVVVTGNSYTFTNVTANHTISPFFSYPDGDADGDGRSTGIDALLAIRCESACNNDPPLALIGVQN